MLAQRARLDAERLGLPAIRWPAELSSSTAPGAKIAMADEARLFSTRRSESGQMRAQLSARIMQYNKEIVGIQAQIAALRKQQVLIAPERDGVKELWDKQLVTINRLNQLERTSADMEGSIASLQSQIAQAQARIGETQEQILALAETRRAESGAQFATLGNTINEQQMKSVSAGDIDKHSVIRAPYAGVVDKLQLTAVGDIVKPADAIMEIVPDHDKMLIDAAAQPNDIDQIRVGQPARIRFSAFNSTATPEVHGKVVYVAAERTVSPDTRQSFFEVRVAVDPGEMKSHLELALKAGMAAEVFIETGNRSMLSYITKPLRDQFARAFRDN
jgi:HlyD family secretion protein